MTYVRPWVLHLVLTSSAVLVLGFGVAALAPTGEPFEALAISAAALPNEVPVMGGIVLQVTVMNPTPEPVTAHGAMLPGEGFLELFMAGPTGEYERIGPADRPAASIAASPTELVPGFSQTSETFVWWGGRGNTPAQAFFTEPGEYRIKVRLLDLDGTTFIESAPVSIKVTPAAPEDQAAYEVVAQRSAQRGTFFLRTASPEGQRAEDLRRFVAEFTESRYATYARFSLARGLRGSHEAEQRAEAIPVLKSVIEDRTFPLRRHALYDLIEALSGNDDLLSRYEAQRYLSQLRMDYPDAERIEALSRLVEAR